MLDWYTLTTSFKERNILETLESSRYARAIGNYVYAGGQKRPHACLQQEFKMEKNPIVAAIYEGLKGATIGATIGEAIALFLKARGDAINKKDFLVLAGVGATIGVLLYGAGRLLEKIYTNSS